MKPNDPRIACECCVVEKNIIRSPFEVSLSVVAVVAVVVAAAATVISYPCAFEHF